MEVSGASLGMGPGAYGLKLAYGNYGGTELAAEKGFTGYNQLRDKVVQGNEIVHRTAGRLAGLT